MIKIDWASYWASILLGFITGAIILSLIDGRP